MKQSWLDTLFTAVTTDAGLNTLLSGKVRLYWQRAPRNATKPYMVYDLDFKSVGEETHLLQSGLLVITLRDFEAQRVRQNLVIQRLKVILGRQKFNTADDAAVGCRLFYLGEGSLFTEEQDLSIEEITFNARGFDRISWQQITAPSTS